MAKLFKRVFKIRAMKKKTERMKRYLKHFKAAGPEHAMTWGEWQKKGETHAYFKAPALRRKSIEAQMRESGMTDKDRKKFERK